MVGSIFGKLLTELGIRLEDAECNLVGEMLNLVCSLYFTSVHFLLYDVNLVSLTSVS